MSHSNKAEKTDSFEKTSEKTSPGPSASVSLVPYVSQLGRGATLQANGLLVMKTDLIDALVLYREQLLEPLTQFLLTATDRFAVAEALFTAQKLAELKVKPLQSLAAAASRWNYSPDPLIQIYLAGFYRKAKLPETFGPMLATLVNRAVTQYPQFTPVQTAVNPPLNPFEELGGALLDEISEEAAHKVLDHLKPRLEKMRCKHSENTAPRPLKSESLQEQMSAML